MDKVPPNYLRQAHEDNKQQPQEAKKSTSIQKESKEEDSTMGASSTESSPPLSCLSSSNDRAATRFATNAATTILSTGVHSIPQSNIQIEAESRSKRSADLSSIGGRKKYRYENTSTRPNLAPSNPSSINVTRDFAHEFLDSDTSLSSSEEEAETSIRIGMHEKISNPILLYAGVKLPEAPISDPASGTIEINLEKSQNKIMPPEQLSTNTLRGIKKEETQNSRLDLKLSIKRYENASFASGMPSRRSSSTQSPIISTLNVSSSASRKIGHFTDIPLGQKHTNLAVVTIVPNRVRNGKPTASDQSIGRWTRQEHEAFLVGLDQYGREWKKVAHNIPTRTSAQIRSHAQKYFAKIARDEQQHAASLASSSQLAGLSPVPRDDANPDRVVGYGDTPRNLSTAMLDRFDRILKDPDTVRREVEETLCRLRNRYSELQRTIERKQQRVNSIDRNSNTIHSLRPPPVVDYGGTNSGNLTRTLNSNDRPSAPLSRPIMTVPLEPHRNNVIEATAEDRVVESNADVRRFIKSDRGALARKELIALHVLGDTLYRSASQENNRSAGTIAPISTTTTQIAVAGAETSVETNENRALESTQESDSTTGSRERGMNSSGYHK